MATPSQPEITQLLAAWSDGDQSALEQLVPLAQAELRRITNNTRPFQPLAKSHW
ncbi:MAG: hypothetical protein AB7U82_31130 [Blastocatellales bacterium]